MFIKISFEMYWNVKKIFEQKSFSRTPHNNLKKSMTKPNN